MFHSCKDYHGGRYYQNVAIFNILNDKNMKYFEVGQTVYDVRFGKGKVIRVDSETNDYPIRVEFGHNEQSYTTDGKYINGRIYISLFQTEPIITPNIPIIKFEQGELVLVRDFDIWYMAYYSHFEDRTHYCFKSQETGGNTTSWKEIRKITDNPLLTNN